MTSLRAGIQRSIDQNFYWWFFALLLLTALLKSLPFLPTGRIWAEEGADFLAGICTKPTFDALTFLFNNHLELLTNFGVDLTRFFDLSAAPAVTTGYSIIVQSLALTLIAVKRHDLGLANWAALVVILCAMGISQSVEVWANTINLHFYALLAAGVILAVPATGGGWIGLSTLLLVLAGLSGVPANFLMPVFLLAALVERSPARFAQAAILVATTALQAALLLNTGYGNERGLLPPVDIITFSLLSQSFWGLFFGWFGGSNAASIFRGFYFHPSFLSGLGAALLIFVSIWLMRLAFPLGPLRQINVQGLEWRRLKLLIAGVVAASATVTLALGDKMILVSAGHSGRYFFAPSLLFVIAFLSIDDWNPVRRVFLICLCVASLAGVSRQYSGPDWTAALTSARPDPDRQTHLIFDIWPPGWTMSLPLTCVETLGPSAGTKTE